ncbi:MAG: hypothetical protein DRN49_02215 [Thaumarchaeota archaeon]|nr:MAG: hypothetical protein DRN49_02215 [Nitrososphaerota archaeon]
MRVSRIFVEVLMILDTMLDFLNYWKSYSGLDLEEMFDGWLRSYMIYYPELLVKQLGCWENLDKLREVMIDRILPKLDGWIHEIIEAWMNIRANAEDVLSKARTSLKNDLDPLIVLYVGSGCGAGWATIMLNKPAILLGLESIADLGWSSEEKLKGLIAHEFGHLYHMKLRGEWSRFEELEKDPYFQLYSEGFAQYCEHLIMGYRSWHVAVGENWIDKCSKKIGELASKYLDDSKRSDVKAFYGSWLDVWGIKHAGYFLGHELINELMMDRSLEEVALLSKEEVREIVNDFLRNLSR